MTTGSGVGDKEVSRGSKTVKRTVKYNGNPKIIPHHYISTQYNSIYEPQNIM